MKITEIRELTVSEIDQTIDENRKKLLEAKFSHSFNKLEDTAQIRKIKHLLAQLQTVRGEKQLATSNAGGQSN